MKPHVDRQFKKGSERGPTLSAKKYFSKKSREGPRRPPNEKMKAVPRWAPKFTNVY